MTQQFVKQFNAQKATVRVMTIQGERTLDVVFRLPTDPDTCEYLRMVEVAQRMSVTDILLDVMESWELEEPLNAHTVTTLIDNCPQAAFAIMEAFGELLHSRQLQQAWGQKWLM